MTGSVTPVMPLQAIKALQPDVLTGWLAQLNLEFETRQDRTILVRRQHYGPMVIQKLLQPAADAAAHGVILHPPGGVAGGDKLELTVKLADKAQVLLTTPGATKWYKSAGRLASQQVSITLAENAQMEWLPQENIIFNGAEVSLDTTVSLAKAAKLATWEIVSLGRRASGEQWQQGRFKQHLTIHREQRLIWSEATVLQPDSLVLTAQSGLRGQTVFGNFIVAAGAVPEAIVAQCRAISTEAGRVGVTALPELFAARYIGDCPQQARQYFEQLWCCLRPWYATAKVVRPRIWAT
jgi:urease accessory protein